MDVVRSCYTVPMVYRIGDDPVIARWYYAEPDAEFWPTWHAFGSANWTGRLGIAGQLGEQPGARPWANGFNFRQLAGEHSLCPTDWYLDGLAAGEVVDLDDEGNPLCCDESLCCGWTAATCLTAHFAAGVGCVQLDGLEIDLLWSDILQGWYGQQGQPDDVYQLTVLLTCVSPYESASDTKLSVDYTGHGPPVTVTADGGSTCDPTVISFLGLAWDEPGSECGGPVDVRVAECGVVLGDCTECIDSLPITLQAEIIDIDDCGCLAQTVTLTRAGDVWLGACALSGCEVPFGPIPLYLQVAFECVLVGLDPHWSITWSLYTVAGCVAGLYWTNSESIPTSASSICLPLDVLSGVMDGWPDPPGGDDCGSIQIRITSA